MYYSRILVLGATIQLCCCLFCSGSGSGGIEVSQNQNINYYRQDTVPVGLQDQEYFREVMAKYDDSVYGWITGQKHHVIRKLLFQVFSHNSALQEYVLSVFGNGGRGGVLRSKEPDEPSRVRVPEHELDVVMPSKTQYYCSDLRWTPKERDVEESESDYYDQFWLESQQDMNVREQNDSGLDPGCYFVEGDVAYQKYLLCDSAEIKTFPKLPPLLDVFEMNYTQVQLIQRGAFNNSQIGIVRINRNEIREIRPYAFEGILRNSFIQIDYNKIRSLWFEEAFGGLQETSILYLEHNQISYENVGVGGDGGCKEREVEDMGLVLPKLLHVTLKGNPLKKIPRTIFAPLRESPLILLILENCQLEYIHPGRLFA
jgi:hypothetical protein